MHATFEWKNARLQRIIDGGGGFYGGAYGGGGAGEGPGGGAGGGDDGAGARLWVAFLWHCAYSCGLVSFAVALVRGGRRLFFCCFGVLLLLL